jgi:thiosulfate/3-mercaptopyruvate sulfurtransferase
MQAVVYDRQGGNDRGRLWWMLKWLGHEAAAALDGGLQAWQALNGATDSTPEGAPLSADLRPGFKAKGPARPRQR